MAGMVMSVRKEIGQAVHVGKHRACAMGQECARIVALAVTEDDGAGSSTGLHAVAIEDHRLDTHC